MTDTFWTARRAFVTGAAGFIGSHVARHLAEQGAEVVCLERDSVRANPLEMLGVRPRVTVVSGALEDGALMERILNEYEIDAVFHLAAQGLIGIANRSPLSTLESNIRGTYTLLEACRRRPTVRRIVVASSDKAYGSHENLPYTEEYALLGQFPYDASKACVDILTRSYAHTCGVPATVTRAANAYGFGDLNFSRIVPSTMVSVLRNEPPVLRSDGKAVRDFVYVEDLARGYLLLAEHIEETAGEAFNLGSGEQVQILDLVNRIIRLGGKEKQLLPRILGEGKLPGEIEKQYISSEKIFARIGWRPQVSLEEGLRRTMEWYRTHVDRIVGGGIRHQTQTAQTAQTAQTTKSG